MKLLRPLRERDFALRWTGMTISLLGEDYAGVGASAADSGSGTPAIS